MNLFVSFTNGENPIIRWRITQKKYQTIIGSLLNKYDLSKTGTRAGVEYWTASPKSIVTSKEDDIS